MEQIFKSILKTPIGLLEIRTNQKFLLSVTFVENETQASKYQPDILKQALLELKEYFTGTRKEFKLKISPDGTNFQKLVWDKVEMIPYGSTKTYLDIALQTGSKNNTRAVGLANGKNPIPIIIPCHRVIGTNGKLTGYAGGLEKKKWLLLHEIKHSEQQDLLF
jgi:methylated-DNA-[protein]-cysteine S-methyltransferase